MNLREFSSISATVNTRIPNDAKGTTGNTMLLGVRYNTDTDHLFLKIPFSPKERMTKRELSGWGKTLDPKYIKRWNELCAEISGFQCKIQRNIGSAIEQADKSTLWIFGDASQIAISCCSYVTHPPNHDTQGLDSPTSGLGETCDCPGNPRLAVLK
ncbi:unnamed protein product [Heligmosomoides polygyrus]|uniref:DDE Tnp4 domain-containing protein n=1 Tax=Heligmosomoides polygyrus TaxID=6339 RepID=A0A183GTS4_HELPZ|nr:unnamed protein product [Heligmosomoides polygyrus]